MDNRVVAILNTNDDLVEMLRIAFENAGLIAVSANLDQIRRGHISLEDFIVEHDPKVIVYDISPPYDRNWRYLEKVRGMPSMAGREFIITSTNPHRAKELGGQGEPMFEIVGKPFDIDLLVESVRRAAGSGQ